MVATSGSQGTKAIEGLDGLAGPAGSAGAKSAGSFAENFTSKLQAVDSAIDAEMVRWSAKLGSFSASPTITPKIGDIGTPGKGAALDSAAAKHAVFADLASIRLKPV